MGYHTFLATLLWPMAVLAGSLADIKHVVFMLQSGRSFDHYFGTMAGVRGFADPNYQINPDGGDVFGQKLNPAATGSTGPLFPWHASYLGGNWSDIAQCIVGGNDGWSNLHDAWNNGMNDGWASTNTPFSMAYFKRDDIPTHFGIAESWTVGDMYQQSVMSSIDPNRVFYFSGSAGIPNGPQSPDEGGPIMQDTDRKPGCAHTTPNLDCWPLKWHPIMKHLQDAGITWQIYQESPNQHGAAEILSGFEDFNLTRPGDPLYDRGLTKNADDTLVTFIYQAVNGTLPQVSWIISDEVLSERPGYRPQDGVYRQLAVVASTATGQSRNNTALFISYDDAGGWFDHVPPTHSLNGTAGEWMQDPYGQSGYTSAGPGFRVPFYIVSPWTQNGNVFTEHADHSSQIMFLEKWLQALGHDVKTDEINPWRRQYMSNLVNAFDFDNPSYDVPNPPWPATPPNNTVLKTLCLQYANRQPPIPYNQTRSNALFTESGFKSVRGNLTVGRYFVFERNGHALANTGGNSITVMATTPQHELPAQHWVLQQNKAFGTAFKMYSVVDKKYVENVDIVFLGGGKGYSLFSTGQFWNIDVKGSFQFSDTPVGFNVYSVTYGNQGWT